MLHLRRFSGEGAVRNWTCWALVAALVAPGALIERAQAQCAGDSPAKPRKELTTEELKGLADRLECVLKALEGAAKETPLDTLDPKTVVAGVGTDPVALFEWVRDNTYLVPYRGVLRDYAGVLMDRLGNSLDRALLLHALLRVAGIAGQDLQLVHADLTAEEAARLVDQARPVPKEGALPRTAAPERTEEAVKEASLRYGLDAASLRKDVAAAALTRQRIGETLAGRVADQTAVLLASLKKHGGFARPTQEEQDKAARSDAVAAYKDHWWVQLKTDVGWTDLDPSLPKADVGQSLRDATLRVPTADIDKALRDLHLPHVVVLRIILERCNEGKLEEATILEQPLLPCALIGKRIALHHVPVNWPPDLDLLAAEDPRGKLTSTVLAETEWFPVLSVGAESVVQNGFTDKGDVTKPKALPTWVKAAATAQKFSGGLEAGADALGGRLGGLLGSRGDAGGADTPKPAIDVAGPKSTLTAEWIEYEIQVPGEAARKVRREVFDVLGPHRRLNRPEKEETFLAALDDTRRLDRGLALLGETEIVPIVAHHSADFITAAFTEYVLGNRGALTGMLVSLAERNPRAVNDAVAQIAKTSLDLYVLAHLRLALPQLSAGRYVGRPNVIAQHKYLRASVDGNICACSAFDVVENEICILPTFIGDRFEARLSQGVADTNAEVIMSSHNGQMSSAAQVLALAGRDGSRWLVAVPGGVDAEATGIPEDSRARIRSAVSAGYLVVAPERAVLVEGQKVMAWWVIRPDGSALGVGNRGWGQTATEKVLATALATSVAYAVCVVGKNFKRGRPAKELTLVDEFSRSDHVDCICLAIGTGALVAAAFVKGGLKLTPLGVAVAGVFAAACKAAGED